MGSQVGRTLKRIGLDGCGEADAAAPVRFTWRHGKRADAHKTFEELPGYSVLLLSTWFLWRSLALAICAIVVYTSGDYMGWYVAELLQYGVGHIPDGLVAPYG